MSHSIQSFSPSSCWFRLQAPSSSRSCPIAPSCPTGSRSLTTLVTFLLTLHLPAHFITGQPGFQFELNLPWIENPAIFYHVGVDGLSLWLVVLVGLLAPIGVLASWNAIQTRRKIFYSLFLVQQTAMFGVFVSLDLMLYYGFWELSLVPMAILIAMYGRKDGPNAALKFFLFTFIPSAPLLVAILWLYAQTGTFNFADLQYQIASGVLPAGALFWVALAFLFAFAVKVPVFPLHGWLADTFSEAPVALAMVVAGKLGLYSMLRFHVGLFPAQARAIAPLLIALAVIGILYGACLALVQRDFWRLLAFAALSHSQPHRARHLRPHIHSAGPAPSIRSSPTASSMPRSSCCSARSKSATPPARSTPTAASPRNCRAPPPTSSSPPSP